MFYIIYMIKGVVCSPNIFEVFQQIAGIYNLVLYLSIDKMDKKNSIILAVYVKNVKKESVQKLQQFFCNTGTE